MNRTQKIVIDSLKKAYDEGQNIFRRPSMQTAFGVINAQAEQLTAAQARITELETALTAITNGYIHETASRWNVTHEFVEKSPLVKQARAALEVKP